MMACSFETSRSSRRIVLLGCRPSVVFSPSVKSPTLPSARRPASRAPRDPLGPVAGVRGITTALLIGSPEVAQLLGGGIGVGFRQRGQTAGCIEVSRSGKGDLRD